MLLTFNFDFSKVMYSTEILDEIFCGVHGKEVACRKRIFVTKSHDLPLTCCYFYDCKAHSPCVLSIIICNIKRLYCYQSFSNFLIFFVFSEFFCIEILYGMWIYKQKINVVIEKSENCDDLWGQTPFHLLTLPLHHQHIKKTLAQTVVWAFHLESNNMWWSRLYALESHM